MKLWFTVFRADINRTGTSETSTPKNIGMVVSESSQDRYSQDKMVLINNITKDMSKDSRDFFVHVQAGSFEARVGPEHKYINMALLYLYRKATMEIKKFCGMTKIKKIAIEVEGVLLSKGRILDGMNYKETVELTGLDLGDLSVRTQLPLIDR